MLQLERCRTLQLCHCVMRQDININALTSCLCFVLYIFSCFQILHLTSALREVVLLTDLHISNPDRVTTSTGHKVTLVLHWTFPEDSAVYYLLYYQMLCDDAEAEFVYLGAAHTNLYKLCGLHVPASTRSLRFKVQPVHHSGLMLPLSSLPSVSYSVE